MITRANLVGGGIVPYFKITGKKGKNSTFEITEADLGKKCTKFSISEKEREILTGSIQLTDVGGLYTQFFSTGSRVAVEWGLLKTTGFIVNSFQDEVTGELRRGEIECFVTNSPVSVEGGVQLLTVQFKQGIPGLAPKVRTFSSGTVKQMLEKVLTEEQIQPHVSFLRMNDPVLPLNPISQNNESNISFLYRMAGKFNVKMIFQESGGKRTCFMTDWLDEGKLNYAAVRGLSGDFHYINNGALDANTIKIEFNPNFGGQGGGVSTQTGPNGQPQIVIIPTDTNDPNTYVLNPSLIDKAMRGKPLAEKNALMKAIMNAGIDEVPKFRKLYFDAQPRSNTASGLGWTAKSDVVPNPLYQIGDMFFFGNDGSKESLIPGKYQSQKGKKATLWRTTAIDQSMEGQNAYNMTMEFAR